MSAAIWGEPDDSLRAKLPALRFPEDPIMPILGPIEYPPCDCCLCAARRTGVINGSIARLRELNHGNDASAT